MSAADALFAVFSLKTASAFGRDCCWLLIFAFENFMVLACDVIIVLGSGMAFFFSSIKLCRSELRLWISCHCAYWNSFKISYFFFRILSCCWRWNHG